MGHTITYDYPPRNHDAQNNQNAVPQKRLGRFGSRAATNEKL
uniref:Uncharacterized protein n=1 Tax=Picea glauca TaxID=3330 RepID=A0A101LX23_PICGL|nr:hypothetical protein ABT39_MTgene1435 [Picea glauca]